MTTHPRRCRHALLAGGAAALAWAAAEELARRRTVRITALLGLAAGFAGMTASVKSQSTEARLNALVPKIPTPQTAPGAVGNANHDASGQQTGGPSNPSATFHVHFNGEQTVYNLLVDAHNALVASHNNLVNTLKSTGILH